MFVYWCIIAFLTKISVNWFDLWKLQYLLTTILPCCFCFFLQVDHVFCNIFTVFFLQYHTLAVYLQAGLLCWQSGKDPFILHCHLLLQRLWQIWTLIETGFVNPMLTACLSTTLCSVAMGMIQLCFSLLSGRGFESHCGPFASNLDQVANLWCAQVNSAFYPSRDGKWIVAYGLRGEGLV